MTGISGELRCIGGPFDGVHWNVTGTPGEKIALSRGSTQHLYELVLNDEEWTAVYVGIRDWS